ncbi:MAG: sigma-70 family RNA polymerase sigma factor [Candidatus Eremiobacteraeota bacterium]|nr:sigma-70 family RNA polymerase sigma factor [Candidatus Eremiobacteraeota bacterium]
MTAPARERTLKRYLARPSLPNRNALVAAYLYLCRRGARKFFRGTVDRADLEQIAAIGLIKASERYSPAYQTPFEAYAWLMIVGELMHFVRDQERLVRVPRMLRSLEVRYAAAYESLSAQLEREPSTQELAGALSVPRGVIDELRALHSRSGGPFTDVAESIVAQNRDGESQRTIEDRLALAQALEHLSERELKIVRGIFARQRSQADIGKEIGVSQRQVSRVLHRTLERLAVLIAG